jgi:hypothetical protein
VGIAALTPPYALVSLYICRILHLIS